MSTSQKKKKRRDRKRGAEGEQIAEAYLKERGYRIRDRNWSRRWGEIDIVAEHQRGIWPFRSRTLVFVEVKTTTKSGSPLSRQPEIQVTAEKQKKLVRIAQIYLSQKGLSLESSWQVDVIAVMFDPKTGDSEIRHTENAVEDVLW